MAALWIIIAIIVILIIIVIVAYNGLVTLRNRVEEAWSDITVQLKRRADLIPNLVNTIKGYAAHESGVFEAVTAARASTISASNVKEVTDANNQVEGALKSLFAVAEAYPDLKANQNFLQLQDELVDTEDKIQASRRFYNTGVRDFNTKVQTFPGNVIASIFKFRAKEFFALDDATQASVEEPVDVKF